MKPYFAAAISLLGITAPSFLNAGEPREESPSPTADQWSGTATVGWDSLYMFRGVNSLRSDLSYGSSLAWGEVNASYKPFEKGAFTIGAWYGGGLYRSSYRELDLYLRYSHSIGKATFGLGYTAYIASSAKTLYSHELNASAAYQFAIPGGTLTPSLTYFFNIGPDAIDNSGIAKSSASFLMAQIDKVIPLPIKAVSLAPWFGAGYNFQYNARQTGEYFTGMNHLEAGLAVPIALSSNVTLSPYFAFSYQWQHLAGTRPETCWGGVKLSASF